MTDFELIGEVIVWALAVLHQATPPRRLAELEEEARTNALAWDVIHRRLGLSVTEQRTLLLVVAAELSHEVAERIGVLNQDPKRQVVDVGLARMVVYADPKAGERFTLEISPAGRLFRYGLLELGEGRRLLMQELHPTRRLIELIHGARELEPALAELAHLIAHPRVHHLVLSPEIEAQLHAVATQAQRSSPGESSVIVVHGAAGSGRRSLLETVAAKLELACLIVDCAQLPKDPNAAATVCRALVRELLLADAMLVLRDADGLAGDVAAILDKQLVAPFPGLVAATVGRGREAAPPRFARGTVDVEIRLPTEAERKTLWQAALGPRVSDADAAWAAARYRLTGGDILRAARSALAALPETQDVLPEDVHAGVRASLHNKLATLADRIVVTQSWADIVLPEDIRQEIALLMSRIENGGLVYDEWGLGEKVGKGYGVSALLAGPPGTGKTMVAGIIARGLGLDLYRIDLSRIASKWIGETEKNLAGLFDAAESGHAILLFDEADAVFAKRTDVKSSTDRYANLEVNFLLQRMESFRGISILTTNHEAAIDEAFKRRLPFRITFPMPDAKDRAKIWQAMLPPNAKYEGDLGIAKLAERFSMSGGYIKNAIERACFIAADRGAEPIRHEHLWAGALAEWVAMGNIAPA